MWVTTLVAAVAMASVHVFGGRVHPNGSRGHRRWLSFAGGVAISYVFLHLLPALEAGQSAVTEAGWDAVSFLEHHVYLMSLAGLVVFYGLEKMVVRHRGKKAEHEPTSAGVFWLHTGSFAIYNALIGYILLHRQELARGAMAWFAIAMMLHLFVMDYCLRKHHRHLYARTGRWLLAGALLLGWMAGTVAELTEAASSLLLAFVAGGLFLNVLKEELPEERESCYWAFLLGVGMYACLLLLL